LPNESYIFEIKDGIRVQEQIQSHELVAAINSFYN